ncbi:MAG: hypothetical protein JXD21_07050 [Candidatus Omnitrophica bacterium]|nr:hypothetical protein [Candidatus Omnitrophota bacterium]
MMYDDLKSKIESTFNFRLNRNQWRDLKRLLYEIYRRDQKEPRTVIDSLKNKTSVKKAGGRNKFFAIKKELIGYRYPLTSQKIAIDTKDVFLAELKEPFPDNYSPTTPFVPEKIFIEKEARGSYLEGRFRFTFPDIEFEELILSGEYIKKHKFSPHQLKRPLVFIVKERWDFIKPCPCTSHCLSCRYWILNLGFGCPFDCSYCFLQQYANFPGIVLPANLDDFFTQFDGFYKKLKNPIRIGTGEFCDSLALDDITGYSRQLAEYFRDKNLFFELKTKSDNIANLLKITGAANIVIAFSLNPQTLIDSEEQASSSLSQRLAAAKQLQEKGYSLAFHFDPIIYYEGWENDYKKVVDRLYGHVRSPLRWISLGTLRSARELKNVVERRFPQSSIFYGELLLGKDRKLRYPKFLKTRMFKKMTGWIREYDSKTPLYLCMEDKDIWQDCGFTPDTSQKVERSLLLPGID